MALKKVVSDDEFDNILDEQELSDTLKALKLAIQDKSLMVKHGDILLRIEEKLSELIQASKPRRSVWEFEVKRDYKDYIEKITATQKYL
jgi:hypothetical protein